ncbi:MULTISPECIES: ABC transporter permease [unclassified Crossiella]|uniref:ABC transporter permease n=1 Tax=unclassified Crossiella TaxID=2620835 RepID=UPI001FFE6669|nr:MULTISPECIES: ABC transporter permease [unclassified Crossiella]MCK2244073.1 ABC transporter permease [Crossiella sp. S99.2]MCK2257069.1 ABC transporter permease [Crossiella sp. S99.1]
MNTQLGPARGAWLVASREIATRMRGKSFVLGTLLMLAIVGGLVGFATLNGGTERTAAVTARSAPVGEALRAQFTASGDQLELRTVADAAEGERLVRAGEVTVFLDAGPGVRAVVDNDTDGELRAALDVLAVKSVLDQAGRAPEPAQVRALTPADPDRGSRLALAFATAMLLYFALLGYGITVAQGVVEEKSSRVVELLLAAVRPWQLLAGKVIGIGLVGLAQLALVTGVGLAAATATGSVTLPGGTVGTITALIGWYLLGFTLYATLFAATGALVSRQEDMQSVIMPVMMLIVIPMAGGLPLLLRNPNDQLVEWVSLLPPFAPMLMPIRAALGAAPLWQQLLAAGLMLPAIALLLWLGGRVYANTVLRVGARTKLTEALSRK